MSYIGELDLVGFDADDEHTTSAEDSDLDGYESDLALSTFSETPSLEGDSDTDVTSLPWFSSDDSFGSGSSDNWETTDDESVVESFTSSLAYHVESFDDFQPRALELARTTIWPGSGIEDILVERLNFIPYTARVTRLTHRPTGAQYVLTAPTARRQIDMPMQNVVARLRLLCEHTRLPVLEVVVFDETDDNPIASPYILHPSVADITPQCWWSVDNQLPANQQYRCAIARQLGEMCRQLLEVRSTVPGMVCGVPDRSDILIAPFASMQLPEVGSRSSRLRLPYGYVPEEAVLFHPHNPDHGNDKGSGRAILEVLTALLKKRKAADQALDEGTARIRAPLADKLIAMASEVEELGYFSNVPICLRGDVDDEALVVDQPDPDGSNPFMVADANPDTQQPPTITQYRDWPCDSMDFAPAFVACDPPGWIWNFSPVYAWHKMDRDRVQWLFDNATTMAHPEMGEEGLEVKQAFDEAAGPLYRRFAYDPVYALVRRLWEFGVWWIRKEKDLEDVDILIDLWEKVKADGKMRDEDAVVAAAAVAA
jgi:hypothetical protein